MAKNIACLPEKDRPYEKLELLGSENLTNSELLAIIIKNGTKEKNCLELAREILNSNESLFLEDFEYLSTLSLNRLMQFDGIGKVKAIQIKAALELAKRINTQINAKKRKITCPKDVYDITCGTYCGMKTEMVSVIILDNSCNILAVNKLSSGLTNSVNLGVKEVFSEPIKHLATSIILVHNHPSGNLEPSRADIRFTKMIEEYGVTFNIKLIDHIIIGKNEYISMKEKRLF